MLILESPTVERYMRRRVIASVHPIARVLQDNFVCCASVKNQPSLVQLLRMSKTTGASRGLVHLVYIPGS